MKAFLCTGQTSCHDTSGHVVACTGSGQDVELKTGVLWPEPRFAPLENMVLDQLTGLIWTQNANMTEFPLRWQEALDYIKTMNQENAFGFSDWRLPNRRELRSIMSHQTRKPALPEGHLFVNVFSGWYWTSTTAAINPAYAWYIHMEGARMFYGRKDQFSFLWPVRGNADAILPATGQTMCYDLQGKLISCSGSGQDGEFRQQKGEGSSWRLPNINELESLVDCSSHSPALTPGHHPGLKHCKGQDIVFAN